MDELRAEGLTVGVLGLTAFRPYPGEGLQAALATARRSSCAAECPAGAVTMIPEET